VISSGRRALGRGLDALLPQVEPGSGQISMVPVDSIDPNPFQPRRNWEPGELEALADSIRSQGILQPIVLRHSGNRFQIIAGERRLRASKMAGLREIPALTRTADDTQMLALALIENIHRKDLGPLEKAEAFSRLGSVFGLTQEDMGAQTGLSRSTVANFMRLLDLPEPVKALLREGSLTMGHGRALLSLPGKLAMEKAARLAESRQMSVRQLEDHIRRLVSPAASRRRKKSGPSSDTRSLQNRLQRRLGARVRIVEKGGRGKIEIEYSSLDELDRLLELLEGRP
jgi:ParB family transcriptional regulator, chromosome partitioning protein